MWEAIWRRKTRFDASAFKCLPITAFVETSCELHLLKGDAL